MIHESNVLIHYGVKGQKWGIRRFQNEDGSLTAEGKERYLNDGGSGRLRKVGQRIKESAKSAIKKKKDSFVRKHKPVSMMSDQELRENLDRMNKERQYKQIMDELSGKNKPKQSFAQKHPIVNQVFVSTALSTASSLVSKSLGVKADELFARKRMERAKEKNMLDEELLPFVYNTTSRISMYNKIKQKNESANAKPTSFVREPKKYTSKSDSLGDMARETASRASQMRNDIQKRYADTPYSSLFSGGDTSGSLAAKYANTPYANLFSALLTRRK